MDPKHKKLHERVRHTIRLKQFTHKTEQAYLNWIKRFTVQEALRGECMAEKINKHVTLHTFRHSFVTHIFEAVYGIRIVQKFLGYKTSRLP